MAGPSGRSFRITGRIPGLVPGRERVLTRSGEPVKRKRPETPEPEDKLDAATAPAVVVSGPEDDAMLDWRQIDWRRAEADVRRLRQRIFTASKAGDLQRVRRLQKLMLRSRANTLVSVRRVTERNAGRLTAGVDGEVVLTDEAKVELVYRVQRPCGRVQGHAGQTGVHPQAGQQQAATARNPDGHLILLRRPTSFWVRWWSRIRFIRCSGRAAGGSVCAS